MSRMDRWKGQEAVDRLVESGCLPADPLPWILGSDEPFAVWHALTAVLGLPADDPRVQDGPRRRSSQSDPVRALAESVTAEPNKKLTRHDDPLYLPGRLRLLAGLSACAEETFPRSTRTLDEPARPAGPGGPLRRAHGRPSEAARRVAPVRHDSRDRGRWCASASPATRACRVPCRSCSARTSRRSTVAAGRCAPERGRVPFVGTRANDLPAARHRGAPAVGCVARGTAAAAAHASCVTSPLRIWRRRAEERPHGFGHGYQFKTVRWPSLWYDALSVVTAVGAFPHGLECDRTPRKRTSRRLPRSPPVSIAYNVGATVA